MGECADFYVGETVHVTVPFDLPHSLTVEGKVRWVWDPFIDVTIGLQVVRFPREAFDCADLELGRPVSVEIENFEQHFGPGEYHPEEEIDYGDEG
jgi:hypothetical protein